MWSKMSRKTQPQAAGVRMANKTRSSLVLKLNLNMLGRLFSAMVFINTLFVLLFSWALLWKTEQGAQQLIDAIHFSGTELTGSPVVAGEYSLARVDGSAAGFILPQFIQEWLPLDAPSAGRQIVLPRPHRELPVMQRLRQLEYRMILTVDETTLQVTYALGGDIRLLVISLLIMVCAELLYLVKSFADNSGVIRDALRPLAEMAEKTRTLQETMGSLDASADGASIKHLAGAISGIDAAQLNRRLSVDTSQNELKDLADAINDMLNRINQAYQSQVRFVSDASHELRTPIAVIQGYANLLDRWGKHDEKTMQESLNAIKSETENMKTLVEQLLFLARGDNETIQLHKAIFDCCDIVDEIIRETTLIDSTHVFRTELDRPAYLDADQQLIKQVLRILVDNSIKYTPAGGEIILRVFNDKETVSIVVQDNGIGIAPQDVSHVFDRFYRSDESRARKTGGSGLGLAIAKWIVERHGGHFELLSRVDIGTRTTVVLRAWILVRQQER